MAELKGKVFYYVIPIRKQAALKNLRFAFPEKNEKELKDILKKCYVNVIKIIIEFFYIPKLAKAPESIRKVIKIDNEGILTGLLKQGRGAVVISGHFGNWELMAYGAPLIFNEQFNIIVKEQSDSKINKEINKIRKLNGNELIYMHEGLKRILTLLKQNKAVVFLSDQSPTNEGSVPVKFFSENVPVFEGAARFAVKTGSPVLFGVPHRQKDNTLILETEVIDTTIFNTVESLTQAHASLLEKHISQQPEMWLWFHKRFKSFIDY
jgi:KDO2-lipid IV(A) lauroyltransferase